MKDTRRRFLKTLAVSSVAPAMLDCARASTNSNPSGTSRHFHFVQIDVFASRRLEGNPLLVFTDARGLSDAEMQALARETNLQETTFVLPRDAAVEEQEGVRVRIFTPDEEVPFAGHPTLGTATALRALRLRGGTVKASDASASTIVLDLKVGRVPVSFREDRDGLFGEMQQVSPVFGQVHDRSAVADALGLDAAEIDPDPPIQTVSTGLPFAIVPFRRLSTLQSLHLDFQKAYGYLKRQQNPAVDFYYLFVAAAGPGDGCRGSHNQGRDLSLYGSLVSRWMRSAVWRLLDRCRLRPVRNGVVRVLGSSLFFLLCPVPLPLLILLLRPTLRFFASQSNLAGFPGIKLAGQL
jgi:PhzF family phenazine biosynthesis protein